MPAKKKTELAERELPEPVEADEADDTAADNPPDEATPEADETHDTATDLDDSSEDNEADAAAGAELVEVRGPCRKCYPDGWPAREQGASASCHHGLSVRFGEANYATRDLAHACDLLETKP